MPKDTVRPKHNRYEAYKGYSREDIFLKSEMTGNNSADSNTFTLTKSELLKDAQKIKEFRGDGTYALTSFLREVDIILTFCTESDNLRRYIIHRIILNKIQGDALDVIRSLGSNPTWDQIRTELINNFGVKETYYQLYHKALSLRNSNVSEYFLKLKNILAKLNEKYEHDSSKPIEYCPQTNENVVLRIFLDNLDPNLASVILSRNCKTLREGYNILQTTGLIREKYKQNSVHNNRNSSSDNNKQFSQNYNNRNHSGQFRNSFFNDHRPNSGNFRNPNNTSAQRWPSHSNHFQPRQSNNPSGSAQLRRNQVEPMDVDHIEQEVNFQLPHQKRIYR